MPIVRFAARDPGAANVLASFIRSWQPAHIDWDCWAMPQAAKVFERESIAHREVEDISFAFLSSEWQRDPARILITGTSHYAPFEPRLWSLAKQHDCPSLAILDYWTNLARRFYEGRPDAIGAIDSPQREELLRLDFRSTDILLTGHPWLASVAAENHCDSKRRATKSDATRVLFVSEPIAQDVAAGANEPYGFDEVDALEVLYRGALRIAHEGRKTDIAIKFHPYENPENCRHRTAKWEKHGNLKLQHLAKNSHAREWVSWADLVVGISSVLLLEAMLLGKPVVSLQPGLKRENTFIAGNLGFAPTLTDARRGAEFVASLIHDPQKREELAAMHQPWVASIPTYSVTPITGWIENQLRIHHA